MVLHSGTNPIYSDAFYKSLFYNNKEILLLLDPITGSIVDCNDAACEFYGYTQTEMRTFRITDLNTLSESLVFEQVSKVRNDEQNRFHFQHKIASGQLRDIEVHSTNVKIDGQQFLLNVITDTTGIQMASEDVRTERTLIEKTVAARTFALQQVNSEVNDANLSLAKDNALHKAILESSPDVILFALDRDYKYLIFNQKHRDTIQQIWGKDIAVGMNLLEVIGDHEDRAKAKANFDRALAGESFVLIEEYGDERLSRRFYQDYWAPITLDSGECMGLTCFVQDITEQRQAQMSLQQEKVFSEALFESIPGYLYVYDDAGHLIKWNKKHEEMTGYSAEELNGMTMNDWFRGEDLDRVGTAVAQVFETGYGEVEAGLIKKNGSILDILSNGVRLDFDGKSFFTGVGQDITRRKQNEKELRESRDFLENLLNYANAPIIVWDSNLNITRFNRAFERISGRTEADLVGCSVGILFPPDKHDHFLDLVQATSGGDNWETIEIEIQHIDGSINTLLWNSATLYSEDGSNPVATIAQGHDITERKQLAIALAQEKQLLETTMISVGDGVISTDKNGSVVFINRVAESLTGWTQGEAKGQPISKVFNIIDEFTREPREDVIEKVLTSGQILELENHTILVSKYGIERPIEDSAAPIIQENGDIAGVVLVFRDFSEKKQKLEEIEFLSYHDQLTGLHNRRYYEEELRRLDTERNLPIALVMADVNGLKLTNDAFGHQEGDLLLKEVGNTLRAVCRADEIVARIGGDEFMLLMPKTDEQGAIRLIERINEALIEAKSGDTLVSVAIGYAVKSELSQDMNEIYAQAEDRMYSRKLSESSSQRRKTIDLIMNSLFEKNHREMLHSKRVSELSEAIAVAMRFDAAHVSQIRTAALMHDIGKIGVEDSILNKAGRLNDTERHEIEKHSEIGYRILSSANEFAEIANDVLEHQEMWDGTGYPRGIAGEAISLNARIIAVADAYDAMSSDRPYRKALSKNVALAELVKCSGQQFDPTIVDVFVKDVVHKIEPAQAQEGGD